MDRQWTCVLWTEIHVPTAFGKTRRLLLCSGDEKDHPSCYQRSCDGMEDVCVHGGLIYICIYIDICVKVLLMWRQRFGDDVFSMVISAGGRDIRSYSNRKWLEHREEENRTTTRKIGIQQERTQFLLENKQSGPRLPKHYKLSRLINGKTKITSLYSSVLKVQCVELKEVNDIWKFLLCFRNLSINYTGVTLLNNH